MEGGCTNLKVRHWSWLWTWRAAGARGYQQRLPEFVSCCELGTRSLHATAGMFLVRGFCFSSERGRRTFLWNWHCAVTPGLEHTYPYIRLVSLRAREPASPSFLRGPGGESAVWIRSQEPCPADRQGPPQARVPHGQFPHL